MKSLLFGLLFIVLFSVQTTLAFQVQSQTLGIVLSQSIEREIKGGETHSYSVKLSANQTGRIEIEQKGVDVSLAAYKPNGEKYIETESPSGLQGNDLILVTAIEAGEYKIEVTLADPRAALGKYVVKLTEIRPTVSQDNEINSATAKITKLANETVVLRQSGTREDRRKTLEKFQEIIALSKIKQDKVWEVVAVISSGLVCEQLGEIQNALSFYLQGLTLSREIGNRQYEGSSLNNLGVNYNTAGEHEKAIFYINQALNLQRETGNKRGEGVNLNNLGTTYLLINDLPKAESFYLQALAIRREIKDQRGEGFALNNLGQVYLQSRDLPKAIDYLQQSLILRRTIADKQGEASTLRNLGKTYLVLGDQTKAFENFEQSNTLAKQLGDRRIEADSFYWLAVVEKSKGNLPKAIENIKNGLQIIEQIRGEIINPDLRTSYFSTVQQFYEFYIDLLVSHSEKSKNEGDIALALEMSERARTRSLVELLQEARVNFRQSIDEKLSEKNQELRDALNAKYRQRTQILSGKPTEEQIAKITNEINSLNTELENLQIKIRRENPQYANLTQGVTLSTQEIQSLLDDKTVLLEYKLGETQSFLWLVTKNSIEIFTLPARKSVESIAKDYYDLVVSHNKAKDLQAAELSKKLSTMLLAPIVSQIKDKRLAIVADGILQYLPFSAFIEKNEVVTLPSASVLAELRRNKESKIPEKTILIFADAVFEANDTRIYTTSQNIVKADKAKQVLRDFTFGENLPRLLSSREEARNISGMVAKDKTTLRTDFEANRENAINVNLSNYQIVHFATHGLLDTSRPEFSGLVFSLYDQNGKTQDGFLRLNQIYNLSLNSDLVVLSACQTALGKEVKGEGLIGLTRGFMYAGAKRVVATLWKVDDAATAEFMKRFYQNLLVKKLKPVSALREAQTEMKLIPRFKSPYYWAGFTLQGDWK